jgi:hypothetical protein
VNEIEWDISSCGVTEHVTDIYTVMKTTWKLHKMLGRKEVGPELNTNKTDN